MSHQSKSEDTDYRNKYIRGLDKQRMREHRLSSPRGIWRNPYKSDKLVHATREHHLFYFCTFLIAKFSGYFEIANALLCYLICITLSFFSVCSLTICKLFNNQCFFSGIIQYKGDGQSLHLQMYN